MIGAGCVAREAETADDALAAVQSKAAAKGDRATDALTDHRIIRLARFYSGTPRPLKVKIGRRAFWKYIDRTPRAWLRSGGVSLVLACSRAIVAGSATDS
jgi:hypothetical protein